MFNPRAHRFGPDNVILNGDFARQYLDLLAILAHKPALDDLDSMSVCYAMLLQDRVTEAMRAFAQIRPEALESRLQYDYMHAYLDFFSDTPRVAFDIAQRHRDHPVKRWNDRFREIEAQLAEAAGADIARGDSDSPRTRQQTASAAESAALELDVQGRTVTIRYAKLEECELRCYRVDAEFSFSTRPFVRDDREAGTFIQPHFTQIITLPSGEKQVQLELPEPMRNANILVQVRGGGVIRQRTSFANSLAVQVSEGYGQLKITDAESGRPLPKVYAKVFARGPNGKVRFHKDGYTDVRGRFDYTSVSGNQPPTDRYAILVISDDHGAAVREVAPPAQ